MSTPISISDVRAMFVRYCNAVERAGFDSSNYRLQFGDSANSYRVLDNGSGTIGTGSYGYLGDSKREAYRALSLMSEVLEDVRYKAGA